MRSFLKWESKRIREEEDKGRWTFYPSFLLLLTSRSSRSISRNFVVLRLSASGAVFFQSKLEAVWTKGLRLRNRKLRREHVALLFTCVKIDIKCRRPMKERGRKRERNRERVPVFFFFDAQSTLLCTCEHMFKVSIGVQPLVQDALL